MSKRVGGKNDGLLAAIRVVEQAERDRALVSVIGERMFKVLTDDKIAESEDRT